MAIWTTSRSARWSVERDVNDLVRAWRAAAEGAGLCHHIDTVSGVTVVVPKVVRFVSASTVTIELLPGQLPDDVRAAARRLAPHLGAVALRVTERGLQHVDITLLARDPLAGRVGPVSPVASALDPLIVGVGEDGCPIHLDLRSAGHLVLQGQTGSGKSTGLYSLLGQLVEAPDVVVTGSDISGLVLGPWTAHGRPRGVPPPATGSRDLIWHVHCLELLVAELDRRIANMPPGRDSVTLGRDMPVVVCVLEEYAGLLRALDGAAEKALGRRLRAAVVRVLAEGRKVGVRVLMAVQRADAGVVGGFERGQASHRLSYRVDTLDALRMLHPDATADTIAMHATAEAGVALITAPGQPLTRLRSPLMSYRDYYELVSGRGGPALHSVAS